MKAILLAMGLLSLLLTPVTVWAEGKTYAILVGAGTYNDATILPKPNADKDIVSIYDVISSEANKTFYGTENIKLFVSKPEDADKRPHQAATKDNVLNALKSTLSSAKEEDTVLVFWIGEGAPLAAETCYLLQDSTLAGRDKNAISSKEIREILEKAKTQRVAFVLDVNFRGYVTNPKEIPENGLDKRFREFTGQPANTTQQDEDELPTRGAMVLATDGLHPSPVKDDKAIFTELVLEALKGKADKEGTEPDGTVTVDELFTFFREEFLKRSPRRDEQQSFPVSFGRSLHFPIATNPAVTKEVDARINKFTKLATDNKYAEDVTQEGTKFLSAMPRTETDRKLRKKYMELVEGKLTIENLLKDRESLRAELKVTDADAKIFSDKIMQVVKITQKDFYKSIKVDELVGAAVKGLYRVVDEKVPDEFKKRIDDLKLSSSSKDAAKLLIDVRKTLGNRDEIKNEKGLDMALKLMLVHADRHTTWITPEEIQAFERETQKEFIGVGIQFRQDFATGYMRVSTPLYLSPAYFKGVKKDDLIVRVINYVNPETGADLPAPETTNIKDLKSSNEVVKKILGRKGTKVTLIMQREEADGVKELSFDIVRGPVAVETIFGVKRNDDDTWDYYLDKENKIVYVRMSQFGQKSGRDLSDVLKRYSKPELGMNGLVLDLRFNPGGYLHVAKQVCELFIDSGLIVTVKPRDAANKQNTFANTRSANFRVLNTPIVVLVNGSSASASEIVSACLQDHDRAIVLGERSYGKGSVQNIQPLTLGDGGEDKGGALKLTVATFWRPSGQNLNRSATSKDEDEWGVLPKAEHTIKLTPTERDELELALQENEAIPRRDSPKMANKKTTQDRQLDAALDILKKQANATGAKK